MTIQGGGAPRGSMALKPLWRMDPPLRSFAADAHDCIMVWILWIRRIQVCGAMVRACWRASLRSSVDSMSLSTGHAEEGGAERRNSMLDFRSPIQVFSNSCATSGASVLTTGLFATTLMSARAAPSTCGRPTRERIRPCRTLAPAHGGNTPALVISSGVRPAPSTC